MTPLQQLERKAEQKRLEVTAALGDLRARLTLRGLADEAAALIDPCQSCAAPLYVAVKRHPLVAAALLAGTGWLFRQGIDRQPLKKTNRRNLKS